MTKARRISQSGPDPEAFCKQCAKAAETAEEEGVKAAYEVVTASSGTEHLVNAGETDTLCGRDASDW